MTDLTGYFDVEWEWPMKTSGSIKQTWDGVQMQIKTTYIWHRKQDAQKMYRLIADTSVTSKTKYSRRPSDLKRSILLSYLGLYHVHVKTKELEKVEVRGGGLDWKEDVWIKVGMTMLQNNKVSENFTQAEGAQSLNDCEQDPLRGLRRPQNPDKRQNTVFLFDLVLVVKTLPGESYGRFTSWKKNWRK